RGRTTGGATWGSSRGGGGATCCGGGAVGCAMGGAMGGDGICGAGTVTSASAQNHAPGGHFGPSASAGNEVLSAAATTSWGKQRRIGRLLLDADRVATGMPLATPMRRRAPKAEILIPCMARHDGV